MKTEVELLIILKEYIKEHGINSGLCKVILHLYSIGMIDILEYQVLSHILLVNRPLNGNKYYRNSGYYWIPKLYIPRLRWCNNMITKYSSNN